MTRHDGPTRSYNASWKRLPNSPLTSETSRSDHWPSETPSANGDPVRVAMSSPGRPLTLPSSPDTAPARPDARSMVTTTPNDPVAPTWARDPSGQTTVAEPLYSRLTWPAPAPTGDPGAGVTGAPSSSTATAPSSAGETLTLWPSTRNPNWVFIVTLREVPTGSWRACTSRSPVSERTRTNSPAAWKS